MISEDEYLERVVAGIQASTLNDAEVNWNEKINGRQFDVVVRFQIGALRFLVLIEVKNRKRKASAEDLDAFVTKARDQNANKAVFVNVAGFQSGAINIAEKHQIDLFTVTFDESEVGISQTTSGIVLHNTDAPPDAVPTLSIGDPEPVFNVVSVTLVFKRNKRFDLPDEQTQMGYYLTKTTFDDGSPLESAVRSHPFKPLEPETGCREKIRIWPARRVTPPDDYYFPSGKLKAIECTVKLTIARLISGNIMIDPSSFRSPILYTNVLTGTATRHTLEQIPLEFDEAKAGIFYFQLHPLRYYYCEKIEHGLVTWIMVESFQNNQKITGVFKQKIEYSIYFIPVTDKQIICRLERRLADFRANRERVEASSL